MRQLDYLIEHKAIRSKSSFIRDAVAEAATHEMDRLNRIKLALERMDQDAKKADSVRRTRDARLGPKPEGRNRISRQKSS